MRTNAHRAGRVVLALALLVVPFAAGGSADSQVTKVTWQRVGAGAHYKKIVKPKKKWIIHMITVNLGNTSTIDVALAGNELGNVEELSSLAGRSGAIAAINGDFGTRDRRPWNMFAQDGNLIQSERNWGRALAVNAPEKDSYIGHPQLRVMLKPRGLPKFRVNRVNNGRPEGTEAGLHTHHARKVETTPERTCSARLKKRSRPRFNEHGTITQRLEVVAVLCARHPMPLYGGVVVSARRSSERKADIKALVDGQKVKLSWSLGGIREEADVIGGNPMIVKGGEVMGKVVRDCGYLCKLHPRSAVGITNDNKLLMVVVDGRRDDARGMYLYELARFFVRQGAQRAMTFDGGGAAEMWIKGEVVNTPSDGRERKVVNALLLLPGADPKQPGYLEASSPVYGSSALAPYTPTSDELAQQAFEVSAADPGSLGGLADFLERQGEDIPPWMENVARDLRARMENGGR